MEADLSCKIYEYFISHPHDIVEIELKNEALIKGNLVGVFKDEASYITKWHITDCKTVLGIDAFGCIEGIIIDHHDIEKISFFTNNSITVFSD